MRRALIELASWRVCRFASPVGFCLFGNEVQFQKFVFPLSVQVDVEVEADVPVRRLLAPDPDRFFDLRHILFALNDFCYFCYSFWPSNRIATQKVTNYLHPYSKEMRKFCLADKTVNSFVIAVYMPMMCWRNGVLVNWKNDDLFSHPENKKVANECLQPSRPPGRLRRERDSNPRYSCPYTAFRVRPDRPLRHLSRSITNPSAGNSECKYSYFSQKSIFGTKKDSNFYFHPLNVFPDFIATFVR